MFLMEKKKKKKILVMDEILVWMELYKIGYGGTWKIAFTVLIYQFSGFQWNFQFLYFSSS